MPVGIFKGAWDFSSGERVSPVQLSYIINHNVVIDSISIDHGKIEVVWKSLFHDPYVCYLIIPSDTCIILHSLQEPGKAPPKKEVDYSPLSFVPHYGSDLLLLERLSLETSVSLWPLVSEDNLWTWLEFSIDIFLNLLLF